MTKFYTCRGARDSHESLCKECKKKRTRRNYKNGSILPKSTADGIKILAEHGIPCLFGNAGGYAWADGLGWGCIPIEFKGATLQEGNKYHWQFTPRQRDLTLEGFILFLGWSDTEATRVFVVPADLEWLQDRWAVAVTIDSQHGHAWIWDLLKEYENAFHLIEIARQKHSLDLQGQMELIL